MIIPDPAKSFGSDWIRIRNTGNVDAFLSQVAKTSPQCPRKHGLATGGPPPLHPHPFAGHQPRLCQEKRIYKGTVSRNDPVF